MTTSRILAAPVLLAVAAAAACSSDGSARAADRAASPAAADTNVLAVAREALGPRVRRAVAFRADGQDLIAALRDVEREEPDPQDPNATASRYAYEVIVVDTAGEGVVTTAAGIFAFDEQDHGRRAEVDGKERQPGVPPARSPDLLWGLADVDGDGDDDPWAAQVLSGATAFSIDLRAIDAVTGMVYRFQSPSTEHAERLDHARDELSPTAARNPAVARWLAARADSVVAAWQAATLAEG